MRGGREAHNDNHDINGNPVQATDLSGKPIPATVPDVPIPGSAYTAPDGSVRFALRQSPWVSSRGTRYSTSWPQLGLLHGGTDSVTTNPNLPMLSYDASIAAVKGSYRSVMNYMYQLTPDPSGNLLRSYSSGGLFNDWNYIRLDFANYFTHVGTSFYFPANGLVIDPGTQSRAGYRPARVLSPDRDHQRAGRRVDC